MNKSWSEMTPAERVADRIARNRAIDKRVAETPVQPKKTAKAADISARQKAVRDQLEKFEHIKASQGVDAAAEFVRSRIPPSS